MKEDKEVKNNQERGENNRQGVSQENYLICLDKLLTVLFASNAAIDAKTPQPQFDTRNNLNNKK